MKQQTSAGQMLAAAAVLALTALSAVYCLSEPPAEAVPEPPTPSLQAHLSAVPPSSSPVSTDTEELEEHGYYQDPLVNQGPLPNRQVPRRPSSRNKDTRQYSRQAADKVVETILNSIITSEMNDIQKCNAVYYYIKGCISYGGTSVRTSWAEAAYWGFTTGRGDEYTFYSCSRALLSALGYQVQEVQRDGGDLDEAHSWCLVNYGAGWYHFDPCPHLKTDPSFVCCLSTDQQLMDFDAGAQRDYYAFDPDAYPDRVGGRADPDNTVPMPKRDPEDPEPAPTSPPATSQPPVSSQSSSIPPDPQETLPPAAPTPHASSAPSEAPHVSPPPVSSPAVPADTTPPVTPTTDPIPERTPEPTPPPAAIPVPEEPLLPPGA